MSNLHDQITYVTDGNQVKPTQATREVQRQIQELQDLTRGLDQAWFGAFIATIFLSRPWLASFDLSIEKSYEYDDQGGYHECFDVSISDCTPVDSEPVPDQFCDDDAFDARLVADDIEQELDGNGVDLFAPFSEDDEWDINVSLNRAAIAHLLGDSEIDGRALFAAVMAKAAKPAAEPGAPQAPTVAVVPA